VRTFKGARASLLRSRGRGSNQRKASWVRVRCGANPTTASLGPGRAGFLESSEERSVLPRPATEDVRGLVRPVRLPQPMGAGGQQPLRSQPLKRGVDSTLRRPGKAEAITVKLRAIRSACGPQREVLTRRLPFPVRLPLRFCPAPVRRLPGVATRCPPRPCNLRPRALAAVVELSLLVLEETDPSGLEASVAGCPAPPVPHLSSARPPRAGEDNVLLHCRN
jgi:hypothetical protein